jgi:hypothetical protein
MVKKYSLVIDPSIEVKHTGKTMKELLFGKIGNFGSKNSIVHITICEFEIDDSAIEMIKPQVFKICDTFTPKQVYFDRFASFDNVGAFYMAPDDNSKNILVNFMKKVNNSLKITGITKITNPHMSIARRLTPDNLKIATELFTTIEIDFLCNSIALREFDPVVRQYFIIDTFSFNGNSQPEFVQGSLF